ncbi:MAG: SPASM domain-containing protein [Chloroflexota bacterium]|nr:SPASM domain-containing protein [Chloroflexota bacterium]
MDHPLTEVGCTQSRLAGAWPDETKGPSAHLAVSRFRVADRATTRPLAELISPLVIESDGTVVPLQYGLARSFALGNLRETPLAGHAAAWRGEPYRRFRDLCRRAHLAETASFALPLFNWYEAVGRAAGDAAMATPV